MKFANPNARIFVPDAKRIGDACQRITHLGIGAHRDDLEFMALHGILTCYDMLLWRLFPKSILAALRNWGRKCWQPPYPSQTTCRSWVGDRRPPRCRLSQTDPDALSRLKRIDYYRTVQAHKPKCVGALTASGQDK